MVDQESFARHVQECLGHLHDLAYLEAHPLSKLVPRLDGARPGECLRRELTDSVERLKPVSAAQQTPVSAHWRRYRYLQLHYDDGLTLHQAARELGISPRQASRDQRKAIEIIANLLWVHFGLEQAALAGDDDTSPQVRPRSDAGYRPALDEELAKLSAASVEDPTKVDEAVRSVVDTIARLAESRGVSLEVSLSDTISPVTVNRTVLRQALFNILSYALEMGQVGRILLLATETSRGVELTLDLRRRRGRPAARLEDEAAEAGSLLDVGRRLLEAQGGAVETQKHAEGGLTVDLVLPPVQLRKVLVIDDNPDIVGLFRRYLRRASYRLVHAGTGESALRLARELHPDVITLDLMMPTQDGWEILQQLRGAETTRSIPVVVCSVLPEKALAQSLGVTAFLSKPITRMDLLSALERCLKASSSAALPGSTGASASPRQP